MKSKHIDQLFKEQLQNLEATPNERVWNTIAAKLTAKKQKKFPIWWFSSGVAAILLLGLFLFPFSKNDAIIDKNETNTIITLTPKKIKKPEFINHNASDSIHKTPKNIDTILMATKKTEKPIIKEKKEINSTKKAMETIFLTYNSVAQNTVSTKDKKVVSQKPKTNSLNNTDIKEEAEIDKMTNLKKVDFNDFVAKKDSVFIPKATKNKWTVAPVFGVLNSNSFTNSSPISKNLANSTQGQNSVSYGIQLEYKINKKWTVQTGVHQQEMSYVNNKVIARSTTANNTSSLRFNNSNYLSFENNRLTNLEVNNDFALANETLSGNLNQTFGYIEVPVEVKYLFFDTKKFNTQIVAGFSSLFLNKNEINLSTPFLSQSTEARNLNTINFSGNVGLDFNYLLNNNWSLNFNPMFKAQLNTFSNSSNGFYPFNLGIYSGIKYNF